MIKNVIDNQKDKWIILIHCICGNENIFKKQMDYLMKEYNIIVIRLAGHNIYGKQNEATIEYEARELHSIITKKNIKPDLIGVSLGAMIVSKYVEMYPKEINNAYIIGCIYGFSIPFLKFGYMTLLKIRRLLPRKLYMFLITFCILPYKSEKEQRKKLYNNSLKMDRNILYSWMNSMGEFIKRGKENLIIVSKYKNVYLIYGERDKMFNNFAKKNFPNPNKVYIISDAGHLVNYFAPKKINSIMRRINCEESCNY